MRAIIVNFILFILCVVFIAGCTNKHTSNQSPETLENNSSSLLDEKEPFYTHELPKNTIGVLIFEYSIDEYKSIQTIEKVVLDDSKNSMLLAITKDEVTIELWGVGFDDKTLELTENELLFSKSKCPKYTVIDIEGYISEGIPNYKVKLIDEKEVIEYYIQTGDDMIDPTEDVHFIFIQ